MIKSFYNKNERTFPDKLTSIKVEKQVKHVDILITINDNTYIIVEDKTTSSEHGSQLERYISDISKLKKVDKSDLIKIYFKTFDQSNYSRINKAGYKVFGRSDFLSIIEDGINDGISNAILADYHSCLRGIEDRVNAFQHLDIEQWKKNKSPWQGLFTAIKINLGMGDWGYVPNQNGGFMGFWFGGKGIELGDSLAGAYILLAQDKLCFKISVKEKDMRRKFRSAWHKALVMDEKIPELDYLKKPKRFGLGKDMTVAEGGSWIIAENGIVNLPATVEKLKAIIAFHERAMDKWALGSSKQFI